ncbi:metabolite traffic protein EboE [Pelagicoccus sp. SDUM812003]|uniref:metabolite traffic protein EboE n=1 Tax=Pelagicoccus sp. SDUM812003 TaxID=3041267 RepID=UPI00280DBCA0|nr:metabolite traffic protein EboE [Pelagicoccus sp. SDUM812003]MDQ8202839.1 metabolite traffic protein EboE [Pelagicoccus sp. SDUM812003]
MRLAHNAHLAYCTNVHPGKDWEETFRSLENDVLRVRRNVCPRQPYAIGLRLSAASAQELSDPRTLLAFRDWLQENDCYVFTINGFPYGNFHNQRVKEQVYRPDWTTPERLEYTNRLFDILAQLLPPGVSGSVSTLPGSFKRFIHSSEQSEAMRQNLYRCFNHIDSLCQTHQLDLHLGLEPEPLGWFENTSETLSFFDQLVDGHPDPEQLLQRVGLNYDTCHFALEYEKAADSLQRLSSNGIRLSKIHLSSALKLRTFDKPSLTLIESFREETYLHQVLARSNQSPIVRYEDLPLALEARENGRDASEEWRIHFHIPLHADPELPLESTSDHLLETLDFISKSPELCQHFEMETYTWAVLPDQLQNKSVVDQVSDEYRWILSQLDRRGFISRSPA